MQNLPERSIDLRDVGGLKFDEETHTYINAKGEYYTGMSTFCKKFSPPFEGENIAKYKAIKNILPRNVFNKLKKGVGGWQNVYKYYEKLCEKNPKISTLLEEEKLSILNDWLDSSTEGSLEHDKRERFIMDNGVKWRGKHYPYLGINLTQITSESFGVITELMVWNHDLKFCGLVDLVIVDKGVVHVLDYKTNKSISTEGFMGAKMYEPFHNYDDSTLVKYSIQLRGYMEMIVMYTGLQIGNCGIIWTKSKKWNRDKDQYFETVDLRKELKIAFKQIYENFN